ncbi:hypothetical protein BH23BAC4_BH23BAC4_16150 [soil metagenome]
MTQTHGSSTPTGITIGLLFACCLLQMMLLSSEAVAQERMQLSATAEQGAVAMYSEPLDVREHSLWGDRRARPDLRTVRVAGAVRNSGRSPVRLIVFAVPEEGYQEMANPTAARSLNNDPLLTRRGSNPNARFLALFWIDIGPSTVVNLADHAPRDPAALARMLGDGPVRFGVIAAGAAGEQRVSITIEPAGDTAIPLPERLISAFNVTARSGRGAVSLLDANSSPGRTFFPGRQLHPGGASYPMSRRFIDPGPAFPTWIPHNEPWMQRRQE